MLSQFKNVVFYLILDQVAEEFLFPRLHEPFLLQKGPCICSIMERKYPLSVYFIRKPISSP